LPNKLWQATLARLRDLGLATLRVAEDPLLQQKTWVEVPFGGAPDIFAQRRALPWNNEEAVVLPGSNIRIGGYIDRLDVSADGTQARVTDYKSGTIRRKSIILDGGREVQRVLYAYAVKTMLPQVENVESRLHYPRAAADVDHGIYALPNVDDTLEILAEFLEAAHANLRSGMAVVSDPVDADRLFALPSGATTWYLPLKQADIAKQVGHLAELWELE
jgi:hypothetical protein